MKIRACSCRHHCQTSGVVHPNRPITHCDPPPLCLFCLSLSSFSLSLSSRSFFLPNFKIFLGLKISSVKIFLGLKISYVKIFFGLKISYVKFFLGLKISMSHFRHLNGRVLAWLSDPVFHCDGLCFVILN